MEKIALHTAPTERAAHDDVDLRQAALMALEWALPVPHGVSVSAKDGHVTLAGQVAWPHQKNAAERAVARVRGVTSVVNRLEVQPARPDEDVRTAVLTALKERLGPDATFIRVEAMGRVVTLSGQARSWRIIDVASDVARRIQGVGDVIDCVHMRADPEDDHS